MLPLDGEVCIKMPNSLSESRLQHCTTQRLGGILEVVNTEKIFEDVSLLSELHRQLATMFWCDANMTSLPFWLTSQPERQLIFDTPGLFLIEQWRTAKIKKQGQNNLNSRSNFQIKLGMLSTQHFCFPKMKRKGNAKF